MGVKEEGISIWCLLIVAIIHSQLCQIYYQEVWCKFDILTVFDV